LLVLFFSACADAAVQPLDPETAAFSHKPGHGLPRSLKLAFVSTRDGNSEIYVMKQNGTGQTNLTNNWAEDYSPVWSPDGSSIAFVTNRDGWVPPDRGIGNSEIYVMSADGTGQINLTNALGTDSDPAWSPDGSKIAFVGYRDANQIFSEENYDIYVMNADGTGLTNLLNHCTPAMVERNYDPTSDAPSCGWQHDLTPAWSPDGSKIAFTSDRDLNGEIYVMNADGTGQTNLTNSRTRLDGFPVWSPDGRRIAFYSWRDGNAEVYVVNADGTGQINFTNNAANDRATETVWSPDGSKIAFYSRRDGNGEIYAMNADGTGLTNLTNNAAGDGSPAWSIDGSKIAFVSARDGKDEIYIMNADGTRPTRLTYDGGGGPTWRLARQSRR
jgi:Tol biopolymer transport system component